MRTKLSIFCLLLSLVFTASGQLPKPYLSAVTDYAKCTHGLKDQNGKQIWKTEFTFLELSQLNTKEATRFFWIAEKNGMYGALNDSGAIIVPFQFEELRFFRTGCFIARKKDATEIYSLSGEKEYTGAGLDEIYPITNGYLVVKKDQMGFLDLQFQERIPISFTNISQATLFEHMDSNWPETSSRIFTVNQDKKRGIYDLQEKLVVPCMYEYIEIHWANKECTESQAVYSAYLGDWRFLYNSKGELIDSITRKEDLKVYQRPLDSCSFKAEAVGFIATRDEQEGGFLSMRMIHFQTHEKSLVYDMAYANGNRILCKKGKRWTVLDEHFHEIRSWSKWNASWQVITTSNLDPRGNYYAENLYMAHRSFNRMLWNNQRVIIYSDPSKDNEYLNSGLYDYVTNKHVAPQYQRISEFVFEGKEVYWAYKISKENQKYADSELGPFYSQVDIYDDRLKLLQSFKGESIPEIEYLDDRDVSNMLFVQKAGKSYGAVNGRGEAVIPAKYKEYGKVIFWDYTKQKNSEIFYLFGDDKFGVFDTKGNQIIAENHPQYQGYESIFFASNADKTFTVYSKNGKLLLDQVTLYFPVRNRNPSQNKSCSYLKNDRNPSENLIFFVKGEQLFYIQGEQVSLADSETFEFTSTFLRLGERVIIDRQAKVIDVKELRLTSWNSICPVQLQSLPIQAEAKPKINSEVKALNYKWERKYDPETRKDRWVVKDLSGKKLSNREFDYPFNSESQMGKIFRVGGKYGLTSDYFREVLPPEYDYISPVLNKGYLVYKDKQWQFYNRTAETLFPDEYDVISTHDWKGKRFVFKDGKVGILTDSLTYLIPLTDSLEFVNKVDLIKVLHLEKESKFDLSSTYQIISGGKPAQVYKMLNNGQLIWYAYQRSTANKIMEISPVDGNFLNNYPKISFKDWETITVKKSHVYTPFYYTEELESHDRSMYRYFEIPGYDERSQEYHNYKIVGEKLIPIQLKDLVNETGMKKLDNLLTEKLTERQYFGQNCTDIATKIERLKVNCLIKSYSLKFHWPDYPKFEFEIYFSELNGILPKEFQKQVSELSH